MDTPTREIWSLIPDDLWPVILQYWPVNFHLKDVMCMRLLCLVFAATLRWRVCVHHPDTRAFVAELRLMYTYNRRNHTDGRELYSRAHTMIFNRCTETPIRSLEALHLRLCVYMSVQGRVMPPEFDVFVSHIAQYLGAKYTNRFEGYALIEAFRRVRASSGHITTLDSYLELTRGALSPLAELPVGSPLYAARRLMVIRRNAILAKLNEELSRG